MHFENKKSHKLKNILQNLFLGAMVKRDLDQICQHFSNTIEIHTPFEQHSGIENLERALGNLTSCFKCDYLQQYNIEIFNHIGYIEWTAYLTQKKTWLNFEKNLGQSLKFQGILKLEFNEDLLIQKWHSYQNLFKVISALEEKQEQELSFNLLKGGD